MKPPKGKPPKLPAWVVAFCCLVPFCSLAGLSLASICGVATGSAGLIAVALLCGRIAVRLLR